MGNAQGSANWPITFSRKFPMPSRATARNGAQNLHTEYREIRFYPGLKGEIDRACERSRKVKQGLDQWLEAVVLSALFPADE